MTGTIPLKQDTLKSLHDAMKFIDTLEVKFRVSYDDAMRILLRFFDTMGRRYHIAGEELKECIREALNIPPEQKQITEFAPK